MTSAILSSPSTTGQASEKATALNRKTSEPRLGRTDQSIGKSNHSKRESLKHYEQKSPIPPAVEAEQPSEEPPKKYDVAAGEDTEQLSDVSEQEVFGITKSKSSKSSRFSTILHRIYPFIRNRKVRLLAIMNFILTIINMALLLILIAFLIWLTALYVRVRYIAAGEKIPCLYNYLPWSDCSATCWSGKGNYPQRFRKVNKSSIIQARGGEKPECPMDLAKRIDRAPCNTYLCPTKLSEYKFGNECYYNDANKRAQGGCYQIREVPLDDRLIIIDAQLTRRCDHCNDSII